MLFLVPAVAFTAAVFLLPLWTVIHQSFTRQGVTTLAGYREIASSALFTKVLLNTLSISLTSTAVSGHRHRLRPVPVFRRNPA